MAVGVAGNAGIQFPELGGPMVKLFIGVEREMLSMRQ